MKLTDNCYAVTGLYYIPPWSVNAGFIAGKKKTLIVDTGGSSISAQTINGYASSVKPDNEIIVINTEKHLDHIGGNGFFADKGNLIFGHESIDRSQNELISSISEFNCLIPNAVRRNANEAAIAFKNTKIVNPDHKFDQAFDMDLGGISPYYHDTGTYEIQHFRVRPKSALLRRLCYSGTAAESGGGKSRGMAEMD